ncbi:sacsin N-terminal ATP-binding-like domain-containing protein [Kineococcus auxinigenes]|uniref:sacsin N-terminal ATP-binding-like domain-containing protein n=1 Tax=unclassified Kineococcus TaxID=2621656 RepID=UPI003D7CEE11
MDPDPFGTARLRGRVLQAWAASPARLREDANAEEDAALGAYRDRLVVELAQNAADAAAAAGVGGRLLLRLSEDPGGGPGRLLAANTGAPLDAAGVQGLATLRASAKRGAGAEVVGRFGVGFSAVLAVTDAPAVASTTGAVRFSREDSAALVREVAHGPGGEGLRAEVERRGGHVPVLRLPFPADAAPPAGYDTAVDLPLRDAAARELVRELLAGTGDVLLLALPALDEVVVQVPGEPDRVLRDVAERWRVLRRAGRHEAAALTGRGVEERERPAWHLAWALPRTGSAAPAVPGVLCAPTPTDEDLPWPALLVATLPLGPDRRRVVPGPAADAVLDAAAQGYCDLLVQVAADGGDATALLPHGVAAGRLDAELRERVLLRARDAPLLPAVEAVPEGAGEPGGEGAGRLLLRPSSAIALRGAGADDPVLLAALAPSLAGLVAAPRAVDRLLTELGVVRVGLADALELLPGTGPPAAARELFAALLPLAADASAREAVSGLPVPLLDGRTVHGARGVVVLDAAAAGALDPGAARLLAGYGLRVAHPDAAAGAAGELLVRLGAREGGAWALLTDPALAAAAAGSPDAEDPDAVADAVLAVVEAAVTGPDGPDGGDGAVDEDAVARVARDVPVLRDLALRDADGELAPAGALVLPGTLAARALDPAAVAEVDPELLEAWGPGVLRAAGVLAGLVAVPVSALDLGDPQEVGDAVERGVAGLDEYVQEVWGDVLDAAADGPDDDTGPAGPGSAWGTVVEDAWAVPDLDLVTGWWPDVLGALSADPVGAAALTRPWAVGGRRRPGPAAWWLRTRGPLPPVSRAPGNAAPRWLPAAPRWVQELPAPVRAALGVLEDLSGAGAHDVAGLLAAAATDPAAVPVADLLRVWALLAAHAGDLPPQQPRVLAALDPAGRAVRARAGDVVVADDPGWAQRTDLGPRLLVPARCATAVADLLDVDLASDRADGVVEESGDGDVRPVPAEVAVLLPGCPPSWRAVRRLHVDGHEVAFWVEPTDGPGSATVRATGTSAAAAGLALAAGRWALRRAVAELLTADSGQRARLLAEELPG